MNLHNHNRRQVGEHVTDFEHELFAEQLKQDKREMRLGSQITKSITLLHSISGQSSTMILKLEDNPMIVHEQYQFWKQLSELRNKLDDLEADFFKHH